MEIQKANDFIEDAMYDDHFASKCMDWMTFVSFLRHTKLTSCIVL